MEIRVFASLKISRGTLFFFVLGGVVSGLVSYKNCTEGKPVFIVRVGVHTVSKLSNSSAEH